MNNGGLRQSIATGGLTLPAALLYAAAMWWAGSGKASDWRVWWGGLAAAVLTGYLLMELNNRHALLRVRSRMVSSTFLVIAGTITFMHEASMGAALPACLVLAYFALFHTYQNFRSQGYAFHAFLFLGIGALVYPKMLWLSPVFLLAMVIQLRSISARSFFAALLGAALPVALREAWLLLTGGDTGILAFAAELTDFGQPRLEALGEHQLVSGAFVTLTALAATVHFFHTKFDDKIRTRMFFYIITLTEAAIVALTAWQPQDFDPLFRLLAANSSILVAHHLTLARGVAADIYFYVLVLLTGFLAFYNLTGYTFGIWPG